MSESFLQSTHMPCAECGASVAVSERDAHDCDPARLLEYRMFQLRGEVSGFEERLRGYLDSPHGRFAQWLAERQRRARG
jgi:hypothetical protein